MTSIILHYCGYCLTVSIANEQDKTRTDLCMVCHHMDWHVLDIGKLAFVDMDVTPSEEKDAN